VGITSTNPAGTFYYQSGSKVPGGVFTGLYASADDPFATSKPAMALIVPPPPASASSGTSSPGGNYLSTTGVVITLPPGSSVPTGWVPAVPNAYIFSSAGNYKQVVVGDGQDIRGYTPTQDGNYQIRGMDSSGMSFDIWTINKGITVQSGGVATLIGYSGPGLPPPVIQPSQAVFTPTEVAAGAAADKAANPSSSKYADGPSGGDGMIPDDAGMATAGEGEVVYQDNTTGQFVVVPANSTAQDNWVPIGAGGTGNIKVPLPSGYVTYLIKPDFGEKFEDVWSWSPASMIVNDASSIFGSKTLLDNFLMAVPSDKLTAISDNYKNYSVYDTSYISVNLGWSLYSAYVGSVKVYIAMPSTYPSKSDWVKLNQLIELPTGGTTTANKLPTDGSSSGSSSSFSWGGITTSSTLRLVGEIAAVVGIAGLGYVGYLIVVDPSAAQAYLGRFEELKGLIVNGALIIGAMAFIGALGFVVIEFMAAYQQAGSIGGALGLLTADILETFVTALIELTKELFSELGDFIDAEVSSLGKALTNIL
jgi:hypothetical protein